MNIPKKYSLFLIILCTCYASVFAVFYIQHFYWINHAAQLTASILYVLVCLALIGGIYRLKPGGNMAGILFILIQLVLIAAVFYYPLIAAPWLPLLPWLAARKAHISWKCLGGALHIAVLLLFLFEIAGRFLFAAPAELAGSLSPDGKHKVTVVSIDNGALGGSTTGTVDTFYPPFEHRKVVYYGHYREQSVVSWKDNRIFTIDHFEVDTSRKHPTRQNEIVYPED